MWNSLSDKEKNAWKKKAEAKTVANAKEFEPSIVGATTMAAV